MSFEYINNFHNNYELRQRLVLQQKSSAEVQRWEIFLGCWVCRCSAHIPHGGSYCPSWELPTQGHTLPRAAPSHSHSKQDHTDGASLAADIPGSAEALSTGWRSTSNSVQDGSSPHHLLSSTQSLCFYPIS